MHSDAIRAWKALTGLELFCRISGLSRLVSCLVYEIGYYRGGCISYLSYAQMPHKVVFGKTYDEYN